MSALDTPHRNRIEKDVPGPYGVVRVGATWSTVIVETGELARGDLQRISRRAAERAALGLNLIARDGLLLI